MTNLNFCNYISSLATKSMLYEVSTTPKPGLVDRLNSGAHNDMNFFTFIDSSITLKSYFYNCVKLGYEFKESDYRLLMKSLRPLGIHAEQTMYTATNGVNTHKGLIFSLGIITATAGNIFSRKKELTINPNEISEVIKSIVEGISSELESLEKRNTYGEVLFSMYGVKGIRGEVESGFNTVINYSLPVLKSLILERRYLINDILVQTLIYLMTQCEDSNILGRHGMEGLRYVKEQAEQAIELGGYFTTPGKEFINEMDKDFIKRNISPGGAADLLAITLMFYFIEKGDGFNAK